MEPRVAWYPAGAYRDPEAMFVSPSLVLNSAVFMSV